MFDRVGSGRVLLHVGGTHFQIRVWEALLAIPCHRVLRGTGALGGYRWGEKRKMLLLARELARD